MISLRSKLENVGYDMNTMEAGTMLLFRKAVGGLAKAAQSEWVRLAQDRLKTSREIYVNGLRQAESFAIRKVDGEPIYDVTLVGDMPNNLEFGMPAFDMKTVRPGWLGGAKAKTSKDGHKYIAIPFRHSTSSDARLGYSGKAAKMDLKKELKRTVKEYGLDRMIRTAGGMVIAGPVTKIPSKEYDVHKYLRGLTRIQTPMAGMTKTGKQTGSAQLMTWRIMSEKSDPGSWLHPGLVPQNLLIEVEAYVNREMNKIVETVLLEGAGA
jgi:hypothetical protein